MLALAALAAVSGLCTAAAAIASWMGERKMQRFVSVRVVPVPLTADPAAVGLGGQAYERRGCAECHGADGAGRVVLDGKGIFVRAPNITMDASTAASSYSEGDWVRAIRHGVNQAGHALLFMPGEEYSRLPDEELAALVAYIRGLPPAKGDGAVVRLPFHLKALYGFGLMPDATDRTEPRKPPS